MLDIVAVRTPGVDDDDRVPILRQAIDDVRPDEAGSAGDCDSHERLDAITDAVVRQGPTRDTGRWLAAPSLVE